MDPKGRTTYTLTKEPLDDSSGNISIRSAQNRKFRFRNYLHSIGAEESIERPCG